MSFCGCQAVNSRSLPTRARRAFRRSLEPYLVCKQLELVGRDREQEFIALLKTVCVRLAPDIVSGGHVILVVGDATRGGGRRGHTAALTRRLFEREAALNARELYELRLAAGVAREQARKDLLLSTYTEAYWKIDLHNLLHFLRLRMDRHAQHEIRAYATVIGKKIVAPWVPSVWEAFLDYRLDAIQLSRVETEILNAISSNARDRACSLATKHGILKRGTDGNLMPNRERAEIESKLRALGFALPW